MKIWINRHLNLIRDFRFSYFRSMAQIIQKKRSFGTLFLTWLTCCICIYCQLYGGCCHQLIIYDCEVNYLTSANIQIKLILGHLQCRFLRPAFMRLNNYIKIFYTLVGPWPAYKLLSRVCVNNYMTWARPD